jgi:hypothetical protein
MAVWMRLILLRQWSVSTALRAWVIAWILAVPLIHIHPEGSYQHGEAHHSHGGTVHTIFSGDPDGEFGEPEEAEGPSEVELGEVRFFTAAAHESIDPSEINFSLLNNSNDRNLAKPLFIKIAYADLVSVFLPKQSFHRESYFPTLLSAVLIIDVPSRAPPLLSV